MNYLIVNQMDSTDADQGRPAKVFMINQNRSEETICVFFKRYNFDIVEMDEGTESEEIYDAISRNPLILVVAYPSQLHRYVNFTGTLLQVDDHLDSCLRTKKRCLCTNFPLHCFADGFNVKKWMHFFGDSNAFEKLCLAAEGVAYPEIVEAMSTFHLG